MIQRISVAAVVACILAACSPPAQQQGENAEGANSPTMASGLQPGQYRTTVTMLEMNIPGMKSANVNMAPTVSEDCVTSSDISEFTEGSMVEANSGESCTQNSMNTGGGRIQGQATCTGPNGTRTMQLNGTYSASRVDMEISSTQEIPGMGASTMRMSMASERIGECAAGAETD